MSYTRHGSRISAGVLDCIALTAQPSLSDTAARVDSDTVVLVCQIDVTISYSALSVCSVQCIPMCCVKFVRRF